MSGLQGFMRNRKNPCMYYKVNMVTEIEMFRKKTGKKPLIVLDGPSSRRFFGESDKKALLTGGQFKLYKKNIDRFFDYFKKLDVDIVAFFDGCKVEKMQGNWVQKNIEDIKSSQKLFDALDSNRVDDIDEHLIKSACNIAPIIQSCCISKCKVILSIFEECDSEIITYAKEHNALAVFSQDVDLVVANADYMCWSYNDIDYNSQTTYVYDRKMLARALDLQVEQLPLLRTMIGNDYILESSLHSWFEKLSILRYRDSGSFNRHQKILKVARRIKYYNNTIDSYRDLSLQVFEPNSKYNYDDIKISVESYMGIKHDKNVILSEDPQWNDFLMQAIEHIKEPYFLMSTTVFDVLHKQQFKLSMTFEDYRKPDIPPPALMWRPIRAHIYGFLLQDYPFPKIVKEWICHGGDISEPQSVAAIEPPCDLNHKLQDFWVESKNDYLIDATWKFFCSSIHKSLPVEYVRNLKEKITATTLIILYMAKKCQMSQEEIDAFLMMSALCATEDDVTKYTQNFGYEINTRILRLAVAFLRGVTTFWFFFSSTCFIIPLSDWEMFDGALLQSLFRSPMNECLLHNEARILFDNGRRFINEYKELFE